MAVIRPFECVRPAEKVADRVAALPYDVYDSKEARAEVEREPLSFLKIDRAETQFDESVDMYSEQVYKKAHDMLMEAIDDGTFITDKDKAYYVYELTMNGRTQTGIAACASIDDYNNNIIKKPVHVSLSYTCTGFSYLDIDLSAFSYTAKRGVQIAGMILGARQSVLPQLPTPLVSLCRISSLLPWKFPQGFRTKLPDYKAAPPRQSGIWDGEGDRFFLESQREIC